MATPRMDNVLIVVEDVEAVITFFVALGLELEGETIVEGPSVDGLVALEGVRSRIVMMRTPDGQGRVELDKFLSPSAVRTEPKDAPVNALGLRRIMFEVDDVDAVVARLEAQGATLVGEIAQYGDVNRLAYVRGPEGIILGLAQ